MTGWDLILAFFGEHKLFVLTVHIIGTAVGLGGATVSDILFFRFLKDFKVSRKEKEVLDVLKSVIMAALGLIALSGVFLYLPDSARYNASPAFLAKASIVGVVTINGIALHVFVAPHLLRMNLKKETSLWSPWHITAFALGAISFVSWYSALLIAMLKTELPFSYRAFMGGYALCLLCAVIGSQVIRVVLMKKARPA